MMLDARAITRGLVIGVVLIAPISIGVKLLRDHTAFDGGWLAIPFIAILAAYVLAGVVAGRAGPDAPLSNGALAALLAFAAYLVVRIAVPLLLGNGVDLAAKSIVVNALLATAFGMLGGALTTHAREHDLGGESARRPRPGPSRRREGDPAEERPDSAGQGAG